MSVLTSTSIGSRALVGFVFAALAGAASANTISLDFDLTPNGMERTDWTKDLSVARFDTSLGNLTGVGIHYEWSGMLSGSVTNRSAAANAVTIEHDLTLGAYGGSHRSFLPLPAGARALRGPDSQTGLLSVDQRCVVGRP